MESEQAGEEEGEAGTAGQLADAITALGSCSATAATARCDGASDAEALQRCRVA